MSKTGWIVLTVFILFILGIVLYNTVNYSDGSRAGTIVKLSKKGVLFKTWEGQLNSTMFISGDAAAAAAQNNIWDFTVVANDSLIREMELCMKKGTRVLLKYNEKYTKLPWRGDTKYIVVGIEEDK
jgi:hypothetical protein